MFGVRSLRGSVAPYQAQEEVDPQLQEQLLQLPQLELEQPQQLDVEQLEKVRASSWDSCATSVISKVCASRSASWFASGFMRFSPYQPQDDVELQLELVVEQVEDVEQEQHEVLHDPKFSSGEDRSATSKVSASSAAIWLPRVDIFFLLSVVALHCTAQGGPGALHCGPVVRSERTGSAAGRAAAARAAGATAAARARAAAAARGRTARPGPGVVLRHLGDVADLEGLGLEGRELGLER
ncbi:hypothetical protein ACXET9_08940 [Brachybacterium sp. DNPG3]